MSGHTLRVGGSTFSFIWNDTAVSAMEKMLPLGLNDFDVLLVPKHLWPDHLTPRQVSETRSRIEKSGIRIDSLNLPALDLNLCSCVPEVRAYSIDVYRRAMRLTADLGGGGVVVVPGRVSALLAPALDDTLGWLSESIGALLKTADDLDLRLHLELHPQTPVPNSSMLGDFVDRFRSPRVAIAYDIASAEFIREDYVAEIKRLGRRIGQIHLSDSTRTSWRHDALGDGTVDVGASLRAIAEAGFDGTTILEVISPRPIEAMKKSLERIADAKARIGVPAGR